MRGYQVGLELLALMSEPLLVHYKREDERCVLGKNGAMRSPLIKLREVGLEPALTTPSPM
jgi:hypothetical protein